jgi:pimeloyl-ACP methyl ester carboxylesterase
LHVLAKEKIPIIHVIGEEDTVVPPAENTNIAELQYTRLGGTIQVIRKPGVGHHPHSLHDPAPLVEFIERALKAAETIGHHHTP